MAGENREGLQRLLLEEAAARGRAVWWRPRGHCMQPAIGDGDRVLVAPVAPAAARVGDVLQYATADGLRIHRLLGRRRSPTGAPGFLLAGDNSDDPPDLVDSASVLGRVVAVERAGVVRRLDSWPARGAALVRVTRRRIRGGRGVPGADVDAGAPAAALLLVCRAALGLADPGAVRALLAGGAVEPAALVEGLHRERLGALAFPLFRDHDLLPPGLGARLATDYYATARRYLRLRTELEGLLEALAAAGIPVLVLKGMALAEAIYGNPALRPMEDLDLAVRPDDLPLAHTVLAARGYAAPYLAHDRGRRAATVFLPAGARAPGPPVDLHWGLVDAKAGAAAGRWAGGAWARSREAHFGEARARVLAPTDALLHVALHLAINHGLVGLRRYVDLLAMGRAWGGELDWDEVAVRATDARVRGAVHAALAGAAVLGLDVPAATLARLRRRSPRAAVLERWLIPRALALRPLPRQDYAVPLLALDRGRDVAALLVRRARRALGSPRPR